MQMLKRYDKNPEWIERVLVASTDLEQKEWPKKEIIEQTIYEKFFSNADKSLFKAFHAAESLEEKLSLCADSMTQEQKNLHIAFYFKKVQATCPRRLLPLMNL
jgi:hypothetical protein